MADEVHEQITEMINAGSSDETLLRYLESAAPDRDPISAVLAATEDSNRGSDTRDRWLWMGAEQGRPEHLFAAWSRWGPVWEVQKITLRDGSQATIDDAKARAWLVAAAGKGHRRASLEAARELVDGVEPRQRREWLSAAYADGRPDAHMDPANVRAAAALLAHSLAEEDDSEAETWFARATGGASWEESPFEVEGETWTLAAEQACTWHHAHGESFACQHLALRVLSLQEVVLSDRGTLIEEAHKPYRNDYQMALSNEYSRARLLRHLIDEHEMPGDDLLELCRLLSDTWDRGIDPEDTARVAAALKWLPSLELPWNAPLPPLMWMGADSHHLHSTDRDSGGASNSTAVQLHSALIHRLVRGAGGS